MRVFPAEDKLLDLKCPLNDVKGLQAVLHDPAMGRLDTVDTLCDSAELKRKLITFLQTPDATIPSSSTIRATASSMIAIS